MPDILRMSLSRWVVGATLLFSVSPAMCTAEISFNRDVRPILSENCYSCHGPDAAQREANLRLDQSQSTQQISSNGTRAVVPGDPAASELIVRITTRDDDRRMPPPDTHKHLSAQQVELLRDWIAAGAPFEQHWAYLPIQSPELPAVRQHEWPANPVDYFTLVRMEQQGLTPSPDASRSALARRVSLDLTGLPPTPAELDDFITNRSPDAYLQLVDQLLASERFGERMAAEWLDAARYADTNGYQVDRDREMYAWRDWVIRALNRNMPFDRFTIEQLAGDLLPHATPDQRIATGFHRNHISNEETGSIPEEFIAEYTADRVETTATIWLGQTFNCARCHDHKHDPFTQQDFYRLKAFFHNINEKGIGDYEVSIRLSSPPYLMLPTVEQQADLERLDLELRDAESQRDELQVATSGEHPTLTPLQSRIESLRQQRSQLTESIPTTLVMEELTNPRQTTILIRGAYDRPGDVVEAGTPTILPAMSSAAPRNRLGLAQWLVDEENPLTARVTVNRYWQMLFGTGLVRTTENFGSQGESPTHPELLDWLAFEFRKSGWDVKWLLRTLVLSRTYQQSSLATASHWEQDPENRFYARGGRFRLPAEVIRDQALFVSGQLVTQLGGASVKPYHPAGLYEQVASGKGTSTYVPDTGANLYRRSLYTYWKRSVPHPAMLVFDAPFRESCVVRRARTNTPLQALNLLNDPTYVEAATFLARRMIREGGGNRPSQIAWGVRAVTARDPSPVELNALCVLFDRMQHDFSRDLAGAELLLKSHPAPISGTIARVDWAAMSVVASTLLNLDETITHE